MQIKQFEIWIVDLNPQIGTESGKAGPVLVVQTNLLNENPTSFNYYGSMSFIVG